VHCLDVLITDSISAAVLTNSYSCFLFIRHHEHYNAVDANDGGAFSDSNFDAAASDEEEETAGDEEQEEMAEEVEKEEQEQVAGQEQFAFSSSGMMSGETSNQTAPVTLNTLASTLSEKCAGQKQFEFGVEADTQTFDFSAVEEQEAPSEFEVARAPSAFPNTDSQSSMAPNADASSSGNGFTFGDSQLAPNAHASSSGNGFTFGGGTFSFSGASDAHKTEAPNAIPKKHPNLHQLLYSVDDCDSSDDESSFPPQYHSILKKEQEEVDDNGAAAEPTNVSNRFARKLLRQILPRGDGPMEVLERLVKLENSGRAQEEPPRPPFQIPPAFTLDTSTLGGHELANLVAYLVGKVALERVPDAVPNFIFRHGEQGDDCDILMSGLLDPLKQSAYQIAVGLEFQLGSEHITDVALNIAASTETTAGVSLGNLAAAVVNCAEVCQVTLNSNISDGQGNLLVKPDRMQELVNSAAAGAVKEFEIAKCEIKSEVLKATGIDKANRGDTVVSFTKCTFQDNGKILVAKTTSQKPRKLKFRDGAPSFDVLQAAAEAGSIASLALDDFILDVGDATKWAALVKAFTDHEIKIKVTNLGHVTLKKIEDQLAGSHWKLVAMQKAGVDAMHFDVPLRDENGNVVKKREIDPAIDAVHSIEVTVMCKKLLTCKDVEEEISALTFKRGDIRKRLVTMFYRAGLPMDQAVAAFSDEAPVVEEESQDAPSPDTARHLAKMDAVDHSDGRDIFAGISKDYMANYNPGGGGATDPNRSITDDVPQVSGPSSSSHRGSHRGSESALVLDGTICQKSEPAKKAAEAALSSSPTHAQSVEPSTPSTSSPADNTAMDNIAIGKFLSAFIFLEFAALPHLLLEHLLAEETSTEVVYGDWGNVKPTKDLRVKIKQDARKGTIHETAGSWVKVDIDGQVYNFRKNDLQVEQP